MKKIYKKFSEAGIAIVIITNKTVFAASGPITFDGYINYIIGKVQLLAGGLLILLVFKTGLEILAEGKTNYKETIKNNIGVAFWGSLLIFGASTIGRAFIPY